MTTWRRTHRMTIAGQAEIWRVEDVESGSRAVMKQLLPTAQSPFPGDELRRFAREVRAQGTLDHPGIMPILGHNFKAIPPWYVMPEATRSLADFLQDNPSGLPAQDAAEIILTVCEAVEYAHVQGIIHRDLKPANVLELDGEWVVADFGLCRDLSSDSTTFTQTNAVVGTVAYMAPEQFDNAHTVGPEADVHALGRMLYHALTGRTPFPVQPLDVVPAAFKYVVSKAMAIAPDERYQTVAEFARALAMLSEGADVLAPPAERGKALLNGAMAGISGAQGALLSLILESAGDEVFYNQFVAKLPQPILAVLQTDSFQSFEEMVRNFDRFSEGDHPFNHVDVIVDFFANTFAIAASPQLREVCLKRIMIVGQAHNRFYAGQVFARLVGSMTDPADVLLATNVMRSDLTAARWCASYLNSYSLPTAINDLLSAAA